MTRVMALVTNSKCTKYVHTFSFFYTDLNCLLFFYSMLYTWLHNRNQMHSLFFIFFIHNQDFATSGNLICLRQSHIMNMQCARARAYVQYVYPATLSDVPSTNVLRSYKSRLADTTVTTATGSLLPLLKGS